MRTHSSLRTLVPMALGSTLLLVGCSSGGGEPAGGEENPAPGQEASAEQPEQPAEEPAPAAVTNEQIRTAIEAIDVWAEGVLVGGQRGSGDDLARQAIEARLGVVL